MNRGRRLSPESLIPKPEPVAPFRWKPAGVSWPERSHSHCRGPRLRVSCLPCDPCWASIRSRLRLQQDRQAPRGSHPLFGAREQPSIETCSISRNAQLKVRPYNRQRLRPRRRPAQALPRPTKHRAQRRQPGAGQMPLKEPAIPRSLQLRKSWSFSSSG
jgi:hypothetical protein